MSTLFLSRFKNTEKSYRIESIFQTTKFLMKCNLPCIAFKFLIDYNFFSKQDC